MTIFVILINKLLFLLIFIRLIHIDKCRKGDSQKSINIMWFKKIYDKYYNEICIITGIIVIASFALIIFFDIPYFLILVYGILISSVFMLLKTIFLLLLHPKSFTNTIKEYYPYLFSLLFSSAIVCCYHSVKKKDYYYLDEKKIYHCTNECKYINGKVEEKEEKGFYVRDYTLSSNQRYYITGLGTCICSKCYRKENFENWKRSTYVIDSLNASFIQEEIDKKKAEIIEKINELDSLRDELEFYSY